MGCASYFYSLISLALIGIAISELVHLRHLRPAEGRCLLSVRRWNSTSNTVSSWGDAGPCLWALVSSSLTVMMALFFGLRIAHWAWINKLWPTTFMMGCLVFQFALSWITLASAAIIHSSVTSVCLIVAPDADCDVVDLHFVTRAYNLQTCAWLQFFLWLVCCGVFVTKVLFTLRLVDEPQQSGERARLMRDEQLHNYASYWKITDIHYDAPDMTDWEIIYPDLEDL